MTPEELLAETATARFARRLERFPILLTLTAEEGELELVKIAEELTAEEQAIAQARADAEKAERLNRPVDEVPTEPTPEASKAFIKELARLLLEADAHPRKGSDEG